MKCSYDLSLMLPIRDLVPLEDCIQLNNSLLSTLPSNSILRNMYVVVILSNLAHLCCVLAQSTLASKPKGALTSSQLSPVGCKK